MGSKLTTADCGPRQFLCDGVPEARELVVNVSHAPECSDLSFRKALDVLPTAIYTTDAHGRITYFNPACVEFSGRTPELGSDRWCVTWKLYYPDGRPMPHDQCPMAIALNEGRVVHGSEAIAERPDGTRIWFAPYATPLLDDSGNIIGGINMLVDITERKQAEESRSRLAAIVESSDDAIISKGLDGVITSWNAGAERLFGYSTAEVIGHPITLLIPPDRLDEEPKIIERLRRGERVEHFETQRMRKDGTRLDVSLTISPVKDASGQVIGASKVARDITERKQAEEQIRRGGQLLDFIIDHSPTGFYIVDADFRISHMNAESQSRAFRNVNPAIGRRLDDAMRVLWPEPLATQIIGIFRHTLETGEPYKSPGLESPRADVNLVETYEWQLQRITVPGGRHAVVCYYYDTTPLREAEQALRDADRRKDEFIATLAHELRNPLAPLRNGLQVMKLMKNQPERVEEVRAIMERQVEQMVHLIDDLMDVSRITRGKVQLRKARVDLLRPIEQAIETSRPLIDESRHIFTVNLPTQPIFVDADVTRLAQIIANLLNNAAKYTDRGGSINLSVERQADGAVITVRDSGVGIPAEMLDRVFEPFAQVDRSLEKSQGGLGIGLSLVKGLIEMHGGTVEAHSDGPGKGSEFVIHLPAAAENANDSASGLGDGPTAAPARRVLVVDDNRDAAMSLAMMLRLKGHEAHTAYDGLEALRIAAETRPDVVLLDIGMPKLNGYDTARSIRAQPWGKRVALIALTGWGHEKDRQQSQDAGFDHHLVKPVDQTELLNLLAGK